MKISHLTALSLALLILAGCAAVGLESKRVDYKSAAVKVPPLDVPPDLTTLVAGDRYTIPESGGEIVAVYSDYSKADTAPQSGIVANVLPQVKNVRLERSGGLRWLAVEDRAENVWPVVKAFWLEHGFIILSDNPEAGLMETDWLENRARIPQSKVRNVIGKVFGKAYSSDEKDMYRTRLERGQDGNSSEIYISHRGMEEVQNTDKNGYRWRTRGRDYDLEADMLQLLMVRLGGGAKAQATVAEASAASTQVAPVAPELQKPRLQETDGGGKIILLSEPFDKSWRKVGLALDQAGIVVDDMDRADGVYFLNVRGDIAQKKKGWLARLMFWRNEQGGKPAPNPAEGSARYQVIVRESNAVSEVSVLNMAGSRDEAAQRILESLYSQLIKQYSP